MRGTGSNRAGRIAGFAVQIASGVAADVVHTKAGETVFGFVAGCTIGKFGLAHPGLAMSIVVAVGFYRTSCRTDRWRLAVSTYAIEVFVVAALVGEHSGRAGFIVVQGESQTRVVLALWGRLVSLARRGEVAYGREGVVQGTIFGDIATITTTAAETVATVVGDTIRIFVTIGPVYKVFNTSSTIAMSHSVALTVKGTSRRAHRWILFRKPIAEHSSVQAAVVGENLVVAATVVGLNSRSANVAQAGHVDSVALALCGVIAGGEFDVRFGATVGEIATIPEQTTESVLTMIRLTIRVFITREAVFEVSVAFTIAVSAGFTFLVSHAGGWALGNRLVCVPRAVNREVKTTFVSEDCSVACRIVAEDSRTAHEIPAHGVPTMPLAGTRGIANSFLTVAHWAVVGGLATIPSHTADTVVAVVVLAVGVFVTSHSVVIVWFTHVVAMGVSVTSRV